MNTVREKNNILLHYAVKYESEEFISDLLNKDIDINEVDKDHQNALHIAVSNTREKIVGLLIENGVHINKKERSLGMTPLHLAIQANHLPIAKLLLKNNAKLDIANKQNSTALHSALEEQNEDMVRLILDYGADVDAKKFGKTPLHHAVEYRQINMVKLLLEKGSKVNELGVDGQNALHIAIEKKDCEMVKLLLENKASTELQKFGKYPLYLAVQSENPEILRLLLSAMEKNEHKEKSIMDALHLAFLKKAKNLVEIFLDYNLSRNLKMTNKSPLHFAIECGWEDIVRRFIKKGFDVNALAADNVSTLMAAVENKNLRIIKILVRKGADMNVQLKRSGQTALHLAIENGFTAGLRYLLKSGANPNVASNLSMTPLHQALDARNLKLVKLLMDHQADSNIPKCGKNSLEIAVENHWHEVVERMLKNGLSPDSGSLSGKCTLAVAIRIHDMEMVKLLIDSGANINEIDPGSKMSPLQHALHSQFDEASTLLLKLGADPNYTSPCGMTALDLALKRTEEMVLQLLRRGATPNIKQRSMLPLHVAVKQVWYDVAELLLSKGVDVNGLTVYNATPLLLAVQQSDLRMARLLIEHGGNVNHKWDGQSLLQFAASTKCPAMVELLLDNGASIHYVNLSDNDSANALYTALKSSDDATACLLIERGSRIQMRNQKLGRTPLHVAADHGCPRAAELLLDRGIPIDVTDYLHMTPLHVAAMSNRLEMLELLLARGADANACSRGELYTCLHFAVCNDNCDMVLRLLKAGAQMHLPQPLRDRQKSSLDVAVSQGRSRRLIEILLQHDLLKRKTALERRTVFLHLIKLSGWPLLTEMLVKHLAKLDDGIKEEFFDRNLILGDIHRCYRNSLAELNSMKRHVVYEGYTLYYLFVKEGIKRVDLARNQLLLDALDSIDFNEDYPLYERMLSDHVLEAKATKLIYSNAEKTMERIFRYRLPALPLQTILDYMTKDELTDITTILPALTRPEKKESV